jgi:AAA15 family ATPase/GTPase
VFEHIEIEGFKSLEKVSLDLGALNIFVGTNASGKSCAPWTPCKPAI